ncbi:MAG: hypothetical protein RL110_1642 [Bacteroidota bacterium]|jgi:penicillin-binding protein 2
MSLENRKYLTLGLLLLTSVSFSIKLVYMQLLDSSWEKRATEIAEKRKEIVPPRGIIKDRNGKALVINHVTYNLMMVESKMGSFDTIAFAKLIGWTKEEVAQRFKDIVANEGVYKNKSSGKLEQNYRKDQPYPFLKDLSLSEISQITPHLMRFPGFYEAPSSKRYYPYPNAANILGYLNEVNREEIEKDRFYSPGMNIGRSGIERSYESILRGVKGVHYVVTDASNNVLHPYANKKYDIQAEQSPELITGIDIDLQAYGELLMNHKKGCIVAIEPSSGEILAMVSAPCYDPNLLSGRKTISKNYPILSQNPNLPLFARPLQAEYPPGSIFKLLQSLICLQENAVSINSSFSCNKSVVGCHNHPAPSSIIKAIQYSCNPYFYAAVRRVIQPNKSKNLYADAAIGLEKWSSYMRAFGLGHKLDIDIDINGQRGGLIPNPEYYDKYLGKNAWAFSTIRSISIGQGEVKLTPIQMANIAAMIANRGWFITPHFVKSIGAKGPLAKYLKKQVTPIDPKHFEPVIEGMRRVVYEPGGTGKNARSEDFTVCGKTGTVQNGKGKKNHSVFIAFAPMENPKIALAVFVENSGAGGEWAAPIAGLMLEKYLRKKICNPSKEASIINAILAGN